MLLATTDTICGKTICKHLGLVRGNTIRARHIGRDIMAKVKNVVGGEISDYTKLMGESREQAIDRMVEEAAALGADAVVGIRFMTSMVQEHAARIVPETAATL